LGEHLAVDEPRRISRVSAVATRDGRKEAVELLIAAGADVNARGNDSETPLDMAIQFKEAEIADLLRKHGGKYSKIPFAAGGGDIEIVKEFLAADADVNAKNKYGETALHYAARRGHKEIAELLIAKGADVNTHSLSARRAYEETALHFAAVQGHKEIAELLIAEGADVNAQDGFRRTPLHHAAHEGHREVAKLLIAEGADVNETNGSGETPLNSAKKELTDLLRKHGGKTGEELKAEGK